MQSSASLPALARGASRGSARDGPASRIGTPAFKSRPMTVAFAGSPAGNVPLFLSPPVVRLSSVQRTGRSVEAAAHAAAKAAQTSPAMCSVPNDLAWDHAPRSLARHAARGEVRVLAPSMAEWVASLDTDAARFRDPLLQLEASLRLWLTTAAPPPHPLRTAAVCEVLARLPEVCVPAAPLLQLLRSELSRALYASYALAEGTGMTLDGNGLLAIEAFHQRATRLEGELEEATGANVLLHSHYRQLASLAAEANQRIDDALIDWLRQEGKRADAIAAAAGDAASAAASAAAVLVGAGPTRDKEAAAVAAAAERAAAAAVASAVGEHFQGSLASLRQHGAALEALLRNPPSDPAAALEATLAPMSPKQRRTALLAGLRAHGAGLLASLGEPERSNTVTLLVAGLPQPERAPVLRALVAWAVRSGQFDAMLIGILETAAGTDLLALLRRLFLMSAGRLGAVERRTLMSEIGSIVSALDGAGDGEAEAECADVGDVYVRLRARALRRDMASQGLLSDAATQTRAPGRSNEEVAAARDAVRATTEARRCREQLESTMGVHAKLRASAEASALARAEAERALQEERASCDEKKGALQDEVRNLSRQVDLLTSENKRLQQGWDAAAAKHARAQAEMRQEAKRLTAELEEQRLSAANAEEGWAAATDAAKEAARFASEAARAAASVQSGKAAGRLLPPPARLALPSLADSDQAADPAPSSESEPEPTADPVHEQDEPSSPESEPAPPANTVPAGEQFNAEESSARHGASVEERFALAPPEREAPAAEVIPAAETVPQEGVAAPPPPLHAPGAVDGGKDQKQEKAAATRPKLRRMKTGGWRRTVVVHDDDGLEPEDDDGDVWPAFEFVDDLPGAEREWAAARERAQGPASLGVGKQQRKESEGESEYEEYDDESEGNDEGDGEKNGGESGGGEEGTSGEDDDGEGDQEGED